MEAWFAKAGQSVLAFAGAIGDALSPVGDAIRAVKGTDPLSGEELGAGQRIAAAASMIVAGLGEVGPGLAGGIRKAERAAQGASVGWSRLGSFTRGIWEVAGDKGAGYVRWNRILDSEGNTVRLYKDVYGQGGNFLRRDPYPIR